MTKSSMNPSQLLSCVAALIFLLTPSLVMAKVGPGYSGCYNECVGSGGGPECKTKCAADNPYVKPHLQSRHYHKTQRRNLKRHYYQCLQQCQSRGASKYECRAVCRQKVLGPGRKKK